jgi:hypothetical protein
VARFREELRLYKTDPGGYELCVRIRNELLTEYTGVELLVAACEHVMFSQCAEYKDWRETRDKPGTQPVVPNDDVADWDRFLSVAKGGHEIKSKCLSALRTVANYRGQDIVQHYRWAYKGRKYCDKLCAAARKVQDWKTAVAGFNLLILERSQQGMTLKRRPILASMNPIEQGDLDNLRRHLPEKIPIVDLPAGFGFDKFGLLVHQNYTAILVLPPSAAADDSVPPSLVTGGPSGSETLDPLRIPGSEERERAYSEDSNIVDKVINDFLAANPGSGVIDISYN